MRTNLGRKIQIHLAASALQDNKGSDEGLIRDSQQTVERDYREQNVLETYLFIHRTLCIYTKNANKSWNKGPIRDSQQTVERDYKEQNVLKTYLTFSSTLF